MSTDVLLKCCTQCNIQKPLEEFGAQKNGKFGKRGMCKVCYGFKFKTKYKMNLSKDSRTRYQENRESHLLAAKKWKDKNRDKLNSLEFKATQKQKKRELYLQNREKILLKAKEYYQQNKDCIKERADAHRRSCHLNEAQKEKRNLYRRSHYQNNKEKSFEESVRRKRALQMQTPAWADISRMQQIYKTCIHQNKNAGYAAFHVDHEIPLKGKYVSGLHVETNLRIIPAVENLKKGRRHVDDRK